MLVKRKLVSHTTIGDTHEARQNEAWSGTHVIPHPFLSQPLVKTNTPNAAGHTRVRAPSK